MANHRQKQSEDAVVTELRKVIEGRGYRAMVEKLHGGPYQNGLPDLLVCGSNGLLAFVEAKAGWIETVRNYGDAYMMLRDGKRHKSRQQAVCTNLGVRRSATYIVIGDCLGDSEFGLAGQKSWTVAWLGRLAEPNWKERELKWTSLDSVVQVILSDSHLPYVNKPVDERK